MGRKARLKRERRSGANLSEPGREIRRRLESMGLHPTLLEGPTEDRKVSDALLELVQPIVQALAVREHTQARLEQLIQLGTLAWNAHLLPDGDATIARALAELPIEQEDLDIAHGVLDVLCERRRALFPDDRRLIISTAVTLTPSGEFTVSAAHAPVPTRSAPTEAP